MIPLTLDEIVEVIGGKPTAPVVPVTVTSVSIDSRTVESGALFLAVRGERFDGHDFVEKARDGGAVAAIVSKPVDVADLPIVVVEDTLAALAKLASFHRDQRSLHVIGVTGSNGKTTTKSMIQHVLGQRLRGHAAVKSFNNHIGVPLTLLASNASDDYVVVEMGTSGPGEITYLGTLVRPTIGVITSIGYAHIEKLGSLDGVIQEKGSMIDHIRPGGCAIVPADCAPIVQRARARTDLTVVTFGETPEADLTVSDIRTTIESVRFCLNGNQELSLGVPGRHNAGNAAATFAVCRRLNVDPQSIAEAMSAFSMPELRLNIVRHDGMTIIDDTYNANPSSTSAAIDVLSSVEDARRVCVIGDMLELGEHARDMHESIGERVAKSGVACVVGVGQFADAVIRGATRASGKLETAIFRDTESACRELPRLLEENDTVLIKGSRRLGLDKLTRSLRVPTEASVLKE